jgi:hypothetical protein
MLTAFPPPQASVASLIDLSAGVLPRKRAIEWTFARHHDASTLFNTYRPVARAGTPIIPPLGPPPRTRPLNVSCNSLTCLSRFAILAIARLIQHIDSGTFFYYSRLRHWLHLLYGGDPFATIILPQNTTRGCAISRGMEKAVQLGAPSGRASPIAADGLSAGRPGRKPTQKTPSFDVQRSTAQGGRKAVWSHSIGSGSA